MAGNRNGNVCHGEGNFGRSSQNVPYRIQLLCTIYRLSNANAIAISNAVRTFLQARSSERPIHAIAYSIVHGLVYTSWRSQLWVI
jgi:hypothetical protein